MIGSGGQIHQGGISPFTKGTPHSSGPLSAPRGDKATSVICIREEGPCQHPDLKFPDFRTARNKFLSFLSQPVHITLFQQPELRQVATYHICIPKVDPNVSGWRGGKRGSKREGMSERGRGERICKRGQKFRLLSLCPKC